MYFEKINLIYFSATGSTAKIIKAIGENIETDERQLFDLKKQTGTTIAIPPEQLAIFAVPVFSGRIPAIARDAIDRIKGDRTPAIIVCVYGNRDFEDTLVEMKDIVESNGFFILSAGAFIAQHSIFPDVATGRPDASDLSVIREFARKSTEIEKVPYTFSRLGVKGKRPYRKRKRIPLTPRTGNECNNCGLCARECPVEAIDFNDPKKTDKKACIACSRCITICPQHAKKFGGLLFRLASGKFIRKYSERQEPYVAYFQEYDQDHSN